MKKVPAILVCDAGTGNLKIAGLTVLDRLVVTAHRAGCEPIVMVSEAEPFLPRARELGIRTSVVSSMPSRPALVIKGSVLVEPHDIERVIDAGGQLTTADGSSLPVEMTTANPTRVIAQGVTAIIHDAASAREAERRLWASLGSSADGWVDRFFNRPLGRLLSKILIHTSVSPNQVSVASILIGIAAAPVFAAGDFVLGALLLQLCAIIDCVDGDLARALFKQSRIGKWLDLLGDQVVHFSVFFAIGIGVARINSAVPAVALGTSAALGVLICFAVIVRTMRMPAARRSPLLHKLTEATANRDFSVLVLVLALIGKMEIFLWMAGIGVHFFWITMLLLQNVRGGNMPAVSRESA